MMKTKMSDFNITKTDTKIERGLRTEWNRLKSVALSFMLKTPLLLKEMYMIHKILSESVPYVVTGAAEDNAWVYKNREFIESYARDEMRSQGYIPVLDAATNFEVSFNAESEVFNYTVAIPGYKHDNAKDYIGIIAEQGLLVGQDMERVSVIEL